MFRANIKANEDIMTREYIKFKFPDPKLRNKIIFLTTIFQIRKKYYKIMKILKDGQKNIRVCMKILATVIIL